MEDMLNETGLFPTIKATLNAMGVSCGELKSPSAPLQRNRGNRAGKSMNI